MTPFQEFSYQIKKITAAHAQSRVARLRFRLEHMRRRWANRPMPFVSTSASAGKPVGEPFAIYHLRLHDMMDHEARGQMTDRVLLDGLCANAYAVVDSEGIDLHGKTTIQPLWMNPQLG